MAGFELYDYQLDAVKRLKKGSILCGGVGSGKSRTALAYYFMKQGGSIDEDHYEPMDDLNPQDLYIITTARKRDTLEWEGEMLYFLLTPDDNTRIYNHKIVVDSWNNIEKYKDVKNAFFIFDEQRVVGSGKWAKTFVKIARYNQNDWILLSATPGDTWSDYIPVFIANGFYKNRTQFRNEHIVYRFTNPYPKIDRYVGTKKLTRLRDSILVNMDFNRQTESKHIDVLCDYNKIIYKDVWKERWNVVENKPIKTANELCMLLRTIVTSDESRAVNLLEIVEKHPRAIIFYNYDYELEILKNLYYGEGVEIAEWNGHIHQPIPNRKKWIYLVQYNAGAEGWNCIKTDTIIFFSESYSYKIMAQAAGRIDRLNTPFKTLYYYHLTSKSPIELSVRRALNQKQAFSESAYARKFFDSPKGEKL